MKRKVDKEEANKVKSNKTELNKTELNKEELKKAYYHLPGLFEFYDFYKEFLPIYKNYREYFYDWCEIGSIYGSPADCLWGGGRAGYGDDDPEKVYKLMKENGISARLTFSNSLLEQEHLSDAKCNRLSQIFEDSNNGIIIYSDLLLDYMKTNYPKYYFVSSTTKVLTDFKDFEQELKRQDFKYVVPDFRLNKSIDQLSKLDLDYKEKVEFLCNEACSFKCNARKECYMEVSRKNLGLESSGHVCYFDKDKKGYLFSKAMNNEGFISIEDIQNIYMPRAFKNFKIEGRSLGSALLLEFIIYYMVKPRYQINLRELMYLDNMLDLF